MGSQRFDKVKEVNVLNKRIISCILTERTGSR
jgi:hypothetical protein